MSSIETSEGVTIHPIDTSDPEVVDGLRASPEDLAALDFFLRCRSVDPCKSWFKSKEVVEPCGFDRAQAAGWAFAALSRDPDHPLAVVERPNVNRSTWHVSRRDGGRP